MAYNNLSGTVFLPDRLTTRLDLVSGSIVSGNLSYSDGADVINVPRVANATNNSLITNVGGDANTLTCESNLIFDGTTLSITGDLTASIAISASFFEGDGSRLTNLPGGGGGSGAGIFTETAGNNAFTTSSVQIGANGTAPTTLSVVGSSTLSGSISHKRIRIDDNYSLSTTDYYVGVDTDTASGGVQITMPTANTMRDGQTVVIKDEGGQAEARPITVTAQGGNLIDGQNSVVLQSPFAAIQVYCDGATKYFIY
jgi:hypothetical protein